MTMHDYALSNITLHSDRRREAYGSGVPLQIIFKIMMLHMF